MNIKADIDQEIILEPNERTVVKADFNLKSRKAMKIQFGQEIDWLCIEIFVLFQ